MLKDVARNVNQRTSLDLFLNKDILITGAGGLIGANLASAILMNPYIDRKRVTLATKSTHLPLPQEFQSGVSIESSDLASAVHNHGEPKYDIIIHGATYAQPSKFMQDPKTTINLNSIATLNLIELLKSGGTFVFLSSSEVYSNVDNYEVNEESHITIDTSNPRYSYILGKLLGESIVIDEAKKRNFRGLNLRLSLSFGPGTRVDDSRVMNELITQAILQSEIILRDSGQAKRKYCYIEDTLVLMIEAIRNTTFDLYNIGGEEELSIYQLAEEISKITKVGLKVPDVVTPILGAPSQVSISSSRILGCVDNFRYIGIQKGLTSTINWYRSLLQP